MTTELKNDNYVKAASHEARKGKVKKVVLLYSGGLNSSLSIKRLQQEYRADVIALTIDLGQQTDDLAAIRQRALQLGAVEAIIIDAKQEFAEEYIAKGIKANAQYQGQYYLSIPLGRPLLAKWAVKLAAQCGADCIAHGATGKGNDQIRLEGSALALNPDIKLIAPLREWSASRDEQLVYCRQHNIPVTQTADRPYSRDDNMWGVASEGGELETPAVIAPLDKILQVCVTPEAAAKAPIYLTMEFEKGLPVAIDGVRLPLVELIQALNRRVAKHAVGITQLLEDRIIGLKVRGLYEAPAAHTIVTAHKALERYTSTRRENEFKSIVDEKWAYLCYGALWFEPLLDNLNAYEAKANDKIAGIVTLKLYKGSVDVMAVETPHTVFDEKSASFAEDSSFNQNASAGFIEHYTSQMKLAQRRQRTAFLAVGGRTQKLQLLPQMKALDAMGFRLYATYKTHKFLRSHGVESLLVNKISSPDLKPNLSDLLDVRRFDLIISIPTTDNPQTARQKELADGRIIHDKALRSNTPLLTSVAATKATIAQLKGYSQ
jgi:argininosuccinate synthase